MKTLITLTHNFDAVYLVNGIFTEKNQISCDSEDVIYLTVLPLDPLLLPYTIKTALGKILKNDTLAKSFIVEGGIIIRLLPRFSYVYSSVSHTPPLDNAERFFYYLKADEIKNARTLLTKELSESLDDKSLKDFFLDYSEIIKVGNDYFLINSNSIGEKYNFVFACELIDDIESK